MRSTKDLIHEMAEEAERLTGVAIAVGFEHHTKFVFHRGKEQSEFKESLSELNALVKNGGTPVGLIGYLRMPEENETRFYHQVFPEHAGVAEHADEFMGNLSKAFADVLRESGIQVHRIAPEEN